MTCACGCGRETETARRTRVTSSGVRHVAGQPKPYFGTHGTRTQLVDRVFSLRRNGRWSVRTRDGSFEYWARIVARNALGRDLLPGEEVHHLNGDKTDDRAENLAVLTKSAHARLHGAARRASRPPCRSCGRAPRRCHGLCVGCYSKSDAFLEGQRRSYRKHRAKRKAQRDARRARQRALGLRVT